MKIDLANAEVSTRLNLLHAVTQRFCTLARFLIAHIEALANIGIVSLRGNVNWAINSAEQNAQATCMVAMFMSHQNGIESLNVFTDKREPTRNLLGAEAGVNKNTRLARNDQNCIAG
jgi:hypothetical protein